MPDKLGRLTPQERIFAERYASTGDASYSAEKAGYGSPRARAAENLAKPAVLSEVQRKQQERLVNEALPLAVGRLIGQLQDKNVIGAALNKAIELTLKYGGSDATATASKEPHEMTAEELSRAINTLERVAADRATPVEAVEVRPESGLFD